MFLKDERLPMIKVAYVSQYDYQDVTKHSGLVYYIAQSLERAGILLEPICPLSIPNEIFFRSKKYFYTRYLNKSYLLAREPAILKDYAQQVVQKLASSDVEVIFSPNTVPIAYLNSSKPIAIWTDATFAGMVGLYPNFSKLPQWMLKAGHRIEALALQKCKLAIYSSEWAAQTAITYYSIDPQKVKVVPFGANIECHRTPEDIEALITARSKHLCRLIFLGVDWYRKGGDIALEIATQLNQQGLPTQLTVVGCQAPQDIDCPKYVEFLGFINKASEPQRQAIDTLLAESHFLILPTRADCTPIVFCEANSFAVPCLTTTIGGNATIIRSNINGKTFPQSARIADYCAYIKQYFSDYSKYQTLAFSTFNEYQTRLNWSVAGQTVKDLLSRII